MYCKVTYPILSYAAAQQQCHQLDQFILNLQTPGSSDPTNPSTTPGATSPSDPSAPPGQAQLNRSHSSQLNQLSQLNQQRSQPVQPAQLIPLATVLDSAQGDAIWFASPRNAQRRELSSLAQLNPTQRCELPRRELEPGEAGSPLLYRAVGCNRARRCCCTCTKLCAHRCLHDCFVRLWLWKRELDSLGVATSPAQLSQPAQAAQLGEKERNTRLVSAASPYFATQCAVLNVYTSYRQLTQVIGSTVSARMNTYIREAQARGGTNLNAMDYSMQLKLNAKGKPIADPDTGRLEVLYWPQSGLCPFCLPDRSYQLKKRMKKVGMPK